MERCSRVMPDAAPMPLFLATTSSTGSHGVVSMRPYLGDTHQLDRVSAVTGPPSRRNGQAGEGDQVKGLAQDGLVVRAGRFGQEVPPGIQHKEPGLLVKAELESPGQPQLPLRPRGAAGLVKRPSQPCV